MTGKAIKTPPRNIIELQVISLPTVSTLIRELPIGNSVKLSITL